MSKHAKKAQEIQDHARIIDGIADCLLEDRMELMNENAALQTVKQDLMAALKNMLDSDYGLEHLTDEYVKSEIAQGNQHMRDVIAPALSALKKARGEV